MNMKNIAQLTLFQVKISRKQIIGWGIGIFSMMFMYMILFPSVQDMAQIKMEAMPEELMQFMGMKDFSDMGNYMTYYNMIYNLTLIAIAIFATILGAGMIAKEEKTKTIEFLYALEVSRLEIYISKFLAASIGVMAVIASSGIASVMCGLINGGDTFDLVQMIQIIKCTSITAFVFLGIGVTLAGVSSKISGASVGSMVVILSYVLGFLSTMVSEGLSWFKYFSPFEVLKPEVVSDLTTEVILAMCGYCGVMILCVIVGGWIYKKRDYQI